jgi:hypothetical protein
MNICGGLRHDEIVFEGRHCPLCEAHREIDDLNDKISDLEAENARLSS